MSESFLVSASFLVYSKISIYNENLEMNGMGMFTHFCSDKYFILLPSVSIPYLFNSVCHHPSLWKLCHVHVYTPHICSFPVIEIPLYWYLRTLTYICMCAFIIYYFVLFKVICPFFDSSAHLKNMVCPKVFFISHCPCKYKLRPKQLYTSGAVSSALTRIPSRVSRQSRRFFI